MGLAEYQLCYKNAKDASQVKEIHTFKVGQIYKMKPGYHTTKPYYVEIIAVGEDYIVTDIPKEHSFKIATGTYEWQYHTPRMTLIGDDNKSRKLLKGQKLN